MSQQQTTAIATQQKQNFDRIRGLLEKSQSAFAKVASKYMRPDRLLKVGLANFSRTPDLLNCTPQSILLAFMQAAELGLEPGSAKKEAYLIPFRNKYLGNKLEAMFLPSYGGLVTIARRSGEVVDVESRIVYDGDFFDVDYGENKLLHKPAAPMNGDARQVVAAWARAWFKGGHTKFEWLWRADVDKVRASSRGGDSGPWVSWYDEMAKKTAVRRLYKLLPKSDEMALAEEIDDGDAPQERYGDLVGFASNVIDLQTSGSRTDAIKQDLKTEKGEKGEKKTKQQNPPEEGPPQQMTEEEQRAIEAEERQANRPQGDSNA